MRLKTIANDRRQHVVTYEQTANGCPARVSFAMHGPATRAEIFDRAELIVGANFGEGIKID